ncbi:MAG: hypothetical protein IKV82_01395 [Akkermansia sp.]|nr:hypothetical protein [Akkermansia sp.]
MNHELANKIRQYVASHISEFHEARLNNLNKLKLKKVIAHKNPYLFKAKNTETAESIVRTIVDAFLSSGEETIFGDWLEGLAIFVCSEVYGGFKSSAKGIDLEFDKEGCHYIVAIKSGPHWGNSSQIKRLVDEFKSAKKTLRTSRHNIRIEAVNGCCYGKDRSPDKGDYFKYCGQDFWEFISGETNLYTELIEPLSTDAKERNEEFSIQYSKKINLFVHEFIESFCDSDGAIDWEKIVVFNSGRV